MMKKEYIIPEMIIRRVFLEGFIAESLPIDNTPKPGDDGDWEFSDAESKKGDGLWSDDVWED